MMKILNVEVWERLVIEDERDETTLRTPYGSFVSASLSESVWDDTELTKAYLENHTSKFDIIKQGKLPQEDSWVGTCRACSSIVKADYKILYSVEWDDGGEGYAMCPVCHHVRIKFTRRTRND